MTNNGYMPAKRPFFAANSAFIATGRALFVLVVALFSAVTTAQTPADWAALTGDVNFYMANDLGRNGYYEQKNIAELMGYMGETIKPKCVVAAGDVHHFDGVESTSDPLWLTNYELIYSHPELMIAWYPLLGNHEYRGNTQAVIDYSGVSRRWMMPARYYSEVVRGDSVTVRLVLIDTTPLMTAYRTASDVYPDACKQDNDEQLAWLDSVLRDATEDWIVVIGHHPVYADTPKDGSERADMQAVLLPVLQRYGNVAIYACGHIHNFQHIKKAGDAIDYVVNTSASLARTVNPIDGTVFCSPSEGFSVFSATRDKLNMYFIDKEGKAIHVVTKTK